MEFAVRSPLAAAVALVGAGAIAVSPLTAPVSDIHLPSMSWADTQLSALASPLETYAQVLQAATANLNSLVTDVLADPTPVLDQIVVNQAGTIIELAAALQIAGGAVGEALFTQIPALLQSATSQLAAGQVADAVNTLLQIPLAVAAPALDLLPAIQQAITQPITNLVKVITALTDPVNAPLIIGGFVAPLISLAGAAGVAVQNVIDAVGTGDISQVVNAVLTGPAVLADGFLNGGYGPDLGPLVGQPLTVLAGGFLSQNELIIGGPTGFYIKTAGPLGTLLFIRDIIATALTPPTAQVALSAPDQAKAPDASAATVTLATDDSSTTETIDAETVSTDQSKPAAPAETETHETATEPSAAVPTEANAGSEATESVTPSAHPESTTDDDTAAVEPKSVRKQGNSRSSTRDVKTSTSDSDSDTPGNPKSSESKSRDGKAAA